MIYNIENNIILYCGRNRKINNIFPIFKYGDKLYKIKISHNEKGKFLVKLHDPVENPQEIELLFEIKSKVTINNYNSLGQVYIYFMETDPSKGVNLGDYYIIRTANTGETLIARAINGTSCSLYSLYLRGDGTIAELPFRYGEYVPIPFRKFDYIELV